MPAQHIEEAVSRNASFQWNLRTFSLILVVIGVVISGYLSYVKLADAEIICVEGERLNCDVVQNSRYAEFAGIPVAYLGLATYLVIPPLIFF